ncbi:EF-hand calcium-binding domain-containing protein 6-like [Gastrophryne carolinensis]
MARSGTRGHYGAPAKLPEIRHSALLRGDPDTLSVQGISRAGDREDCPASTNDMTALHIPPQRYRTEGLHTWSSLDQWANSRQCTESAGTGVEHFVIEFTNLKRWGYLVIELAYLQHCGVFDKKFWKRNKNEKKNEEVLMYNSAQLKNQVEEIEFQLLEKINSGRFYEMKNLFLSQDPEGRGRVTRDALLVILTTFLGQFISNVQFQHLLHRLRLAEKSIITFDSFYDHFKLQENTSPPDWLDPMKRKQKTSLKTAHEVHLELKNMANHRYFEFLKLFPKDSVTFSGLRSALSRLGLIMADEAFEKLWQRYCREKNGILGIEDLQRHLGATNAQDLYVEPNMLLSALQKVSESRGAQKGTSTVSGSRMTSERTLSLSIEKWLKEKFRQGAQAMMAEFLVCDPGRTHKVSRDDFLRVLQMFQLPLTQEQLGHFLARCGLEENSPNVDYVAFLQCLQHKGRDVRAHKILCTPRNRFMCDSPVLIYDIQVYDPQVFMYHLFMFVLPRFKCDHLVLMYDPSVFMGYLSVLMYDPSVFMGDLSVFIYDIPVIMFGMNLGQSKSRGSVSSTSTTGILEERLLSFFHTDFTGLLQEFRKADKNKMNVISQQDFRAILERRYSLKVTDEEFAYLMERMPLDLHGAIRYLDFMSKFDSGDELLSLQGGNKTVLTKCSRKPTATSKPQANGKKHQVQERSVEQLSEIIKHLVKNNYESLERTFNDMDAMNTRRLTSESLYQLMKRCGIQPKMSREEVRKLWKMLIQNQDNTVDYFQFIRHFGYSTKSSCFPNAKISPPVRGDGDCLVRSLKLNSDTKIIANFLQTKVKLLLDDLWLQFRELDPKNSGCITKEEFLDILQELSPDLTKHQCDSLANKFVYGNNKVSYVKFLQPYQTRQISIRQNGVKENIPEAKETSLRGSVHGGLKTIASKLRQKLSPVDWKNLLQACQKLDTNGTGLLVLSEFRSVVKLCNIILDEDDLYQIMSRYDPDLTGRIDYPRLISDHNLRE